MAKWTASAGWVANTITLNSVANNATALASTDITNGTSLEIYADVSLILGSITPAAAGYMELHLRGLMHDGTNYPDVVTSGTLVATSALSSGASIKYVLFRGILVPPGTFRWGIVNRAGVTLAGSGNALQHRLYSPA